MWSVAGRGRHLGGVDALALLRAPEASSVGRARGAGRVVVLTSRRPTCEGATKEMMQPCLIYPRVISLVGSTTHRSF